MKRFKFKFIVLALLLLCSCSANPSKVSKSKAKKLAESITYVQDERTGVCYAVVSSRIYTLGLFPSAQKGLGLTVVPCEKCREYLQK